MKKTKYDLKTGVPIELIDYDIKHLMYQLKKSNEGQKIFNAEAYMEDFDKAIRSEIRNLDEAEAILKSEVHDQIMNVFESFTEQMYQLFLMKKYLHEMVNKQVVQEEDLVAAQEYAIQEEQNQFKAGQISDLDPIELLTFFQEEEELPQDAFGEKVQQRSKARRGPAGGYL